jgi:hypothetical protein
MSTAAQQTTPEARAEHWPSFLRHLWSGRGTAARRRGSFVLGGLALFIAAVIYTFALAALSQPAGLNIAGWGFLLLAVAAAFMGIRAIVFAIIRLGLRGILLRLAVLYVLFVLATGLLVPTGLQGTEHWVTTAGAVLSWPFDALTGTGDRLAAAWDDLHFAVMGERDSIPVPGVEWPDGVPPALVVSDERSARKVDNAPVIEPTQQPVPASGGEGLHPGAVARVIGTEGAALRAREQPGTDTRIVARFPPESRLEIVDGPQQAGGRTWWKVRGPQGEGWCAAEFLAVDETR